MDSGTTGRRDVDEPSRWQPQAAEPSDLEADAEADFVGVLVLPPAGEESEVVDEDELSESLEGAEEGLELESFRESLPEPLPESGWEPFVVLLRDLPRESLRESLR